MRIAVVTSLYPSPPRPHEGIFAERRWLGMHARGHEVQLLHPQPRTIWPLTLGHYGEIHRMPRREQRAGLEVERPRYWHLPGRALGNAQRFAACAHGHLREPDVVVCDYAWPASALAPALAREARACVISGRGSDVLQVAGEAGLAGPLACNLKAAGHWCAVSQDLVDAMDRLGERGARGRLVPNGVDAEYFQPREREAARRSCGYRHPGPLVLVVGHLIERKDPLLALDAFRRGAPAQARLAFLGKGPLEESLRVAIAEAGLESRIDLLGERPPDELAEWYGACDLLLLTSRREGRPNVVLEALASGRPVLATDAGGTAELLPHAEMLSPSREPQVLASALTAALERGCDARSLADSVSHLSWEASLDALEACLQEAIGELHS